MVVSNILKGAACVVLVTGVATADLTPTAAYVTEPPVDRAEMLFDAHDCWRGPAPEGVTFPGHVIWQRPDGRVTYSKRLVGPALDAIFGDGTLAGTPIAFCK